MASVEYWPPAGEQAVRGRNKFYMALVPWVVIFLLSLFYALFVPVALDPAVLWFAVGMSALLVILMVRDGYRRYQVFYQANVLPSLVSRDATVSADPFGGVSLLVLEPSRLFPGAESVKTQTYLRGIVDGHIVEMSALDITRKRITRRKRKIQTPVFRGAIFCFDLGVPVVAGDSHFFGPRARRTWAHRRLARSFLRMPLPGTGFGVRAWGQSGSRKSWTPEARSAIKALMTLCPHARVSVFGGRHVVVAVPYFNKYFRPAGLFIAPRRDPHMGRVLNVFRAIVHLGVALGAQPQRVYTHGGAPSVSRNPVMPSMQPGPQGHRQASRLKKTEKPLFPRETREKWARRASDLFQSGAYSLGVMWGRLAPLRSKTKGVADRIRKEGVKTAREVGELAAHTNVGERFLERVDRFRAPVKGNDERDESADIDAMRRFAKRDDDT